MASILLGDLNDYIQPTVACIKPAEASSKDSNDSNKLGKPVEINLKDCLACAGCITSAETVLVASQTHHQVYEFCRENAGRPTAEKRVLLVSICAATRTALAQRYQLSPDETHGKLIAFFKTYFEAAAVVDTNFASFIALQEAAEEFFEHYRREGTRQLPRMSSECPGWICYVEKRQPRLIPQVCTVRSPQQIVGALAKSFLLECTFGRLMGRTLCRADVFHVSVMSCYDKKLEAARGDFSAKDGVRDVDCVITTGELMAMIQDKVGGSFLDIPEAQSCADDPFRAWNTLCSPAGYYGGSGGSYLFYILRAAAKVLFAIDLPVNILVDPRISLHYHRGNVDYTEYTLVRCPEDGEPPLLRFAAIAGFRNIQTFVQKCKSNRIDYDYVEVMACPGACLFGGGQPPFGEDGSSSDKNQLRGEMEKLYLTHRGRLPSLALAEVAAIYEWIAEDEECRRPLLYTSYRPLESVTKPLINVQW